MPVLQRAASGAARDPRPTAVRKAVERLPDLTFVVFDDGVAIGRLIAGEPERVERERVLIRGRPLLLDQAAEDANLDGADVHGAEDYALEPRLQSANADVAQLVEHQLPKLRVAGSNPVVRSHESPARLGFLYVVTLRM